MFPFVNEDYYEGKVGYKRERYEVTFADGTYYSMHKGKVED